MDIRQRVVATTGVELSLQDGGEGPLVVLAHGFPELASWRHPVPAHLSGDLLGVLDDVVEERSILVGHQWGLLVLLGFVESVYAGGRP